MWFLSGNTETDLVYLHHVCRWPARTPGQPLVHVFRGGGRRVSVTVMMGPKGRPYSGIVRMGICTIRSRIRSEMALVVDVVGVVQGLVEAGKKGQASVVDVTKRLYILDPNEKGGVTCHLEAATPLSRSLKIPPHS